MNLDALNKYLHKFGKLHRAANKMYGHAPHKPILLLAVLDEIEREAYGDGVIRITPELIAGFHTFWKGLVYSEYWKATMQNPFRYLYQEGWWHFIKSGIEVPPGETAPSLRYMAEEFDGVRLSPDLWQLLQDRESLNFLRGHLLQTYFGKLSASDVVRESTETYLYAEAEKLTAEARRPFQNRVRERKEEIYYLRHALFPKVIRGIYAESCCVCGLSARDSKAPGSNILDGIHIVPFAVSHNDDPRNGMSLCKNHHWGFDRGWFSVSDDYRVLVSPQLLNGTGYVTPGVTIYLPTAPILYPAQDALRWHRENVFQQ